MHMNQQKNKEIIPEKEINTLQSIANLQIVKKKRKQMVWNKQQNQTYVDFLNKNKDILLNKVSRRKSRIFGKLSKLLKARTAEQCRTHHQKMLQTHRTLARIIQYLETTLEDQTNQKSSQKSFSQQIQLNDTIQVEKDENPNENIQFQKFTEPENIIEDPFLWCMIDDQFWSKQWDQARNEQNFGSVYWEYHED